MKRQNCKIYNNNAGTSIHRGNIATGDPTQLAKR